jgi:hypothetical protein
MIGNQVRTQIFLFFLETPSFLRPATGAGMMISEYNTAEEVFLFGSAVILKGQYDDLETLPLDVYPHAMIYIEFVSIKVIYSFSLKYK